MFSQSFLQFAARSDCSVFVCDGKLWLEIVLVLSLFVGRDSSVGIATRCGLNIRGIESRWRRDFPQPSTPALGPPSFLYNGYRISFPGVKQPGRDVNHPPPFSAEIKERVALYMYFPLWAFMVCSRAKFTLPFCKTLSVTFCY